MNVRRSPLVVVASVAALTTLSLAGPALAQDDGDFDIQKAVDDAEPGDTIDIPSGTYKQSVTITKDGISLRGDDVVIDASTADPTDCDTLGCSRIPTARCVRCLHPRQRRREDVRGHRARE